ncbi:efflux RND transporter periplasmic adaptor subunit [Pseudaminobacter sp. NGMCC 1.201702]|uniref:efflux RND transporter periplasmic adaptor subunit n=1 Tax=Pseudaminobacter sp. NGMCC 1.201702 TaxID=3391825 RepID=UPI0039EF0BA0
MSRSNLIIALLSASLIAGPALAQQAAKAPAVVVAPAKLMDLRESIGFTGRVVARQKVDLRARASGFVEAINFTEGENVAKGTVLYEIEDGAYRAALQEIQGSIAAAEGQSRLAMVDRDRKAKLLQRQTGSLADLDAAEAQLAKSEGELTRLGGSKSNAELNLSYTKIIAPFDGNLGLSAVDIGALVGPDSAALVTLTQLDPINVEFSVATATYLRFRERQQKGEIGNEANVQLVLPDGSTYPSKGTINFVSTNVAQGTDTITVRAGFDNPNSVLLDGALVRVQLEQSQPQEVLAVPQQAVQRDQTGTFVIMVGGDSVAELRRVDVARNAKGQAVIAKGLEEGDLVITEGVGKVRPGMKVDAGQATGG